MKTHSEISESFSRILIACGVVAGFASILSLPRPVQERFQGKTPTQWARLLTAKPTEFQNAPVSLRPDLAPHLVMELRRYSNPLRGELRDSLSCWLYDLAPEAIRAGAPGPIPACERRRNAIILLGELGPLAQEAVPVLIPFLDDDALQCSVILTLQAIGPPARTAVPRMLQLLSEAPEPRLATALAMLAPQDPTVIRTLAELSRAGPSTVRQEAAAALKVCLAKLAASPAPLRGETAGIDAR